MSRSQIWGTYTYHKLHCDSKQLGISHPAIMLTLSTAAPFPNPLDYCDLSSHLLCQDRLGPEEMTMQLQTMWQSLLHYIHDHRIHIFSESVLSNIRFLATMSAIDFTFEEPETCIFLQFSFVRDIQQVKQVSSSPDLIFVWGWFSSSLPLITALWCLTWGELSLWNER